jgi:hypothetical protein
MRPAPVGSRYADADFELFEDEYVHFKGTSAS